MEVINLLINFLFLKYIKYMTILLSAQLNIRNGIEKCFGGCHERDCDNEENLA